MLIIKIQSTEGRSHLSRLRGRGGLTALLGSGISIWEPSNLPNGQRVTQELAEVIAHSTVSPKETVIDLITRSPFEHIMDRYPLVQVLPDVISQAYYPTTVNPVHEAFATLVESGIIEHIITPNYDTGIEQACSARCRAPRMPQVVISEDDAKRASASMPIIFKIHGCASPGNEHSLVITLRSEGELPEWKRMLLRTLIEGRPLLVCGYSGLDFEISPELIHTNPAEVTWNSYLDPRLEEQALTSNARRVLAAKGGHTLVGDMVGLLEGLGSGSCRARASKPARSFAGDLTARLDEWETEKWRAWVLNGLSCALDGAEAAKRMCLKSGTSVERRIDSLLALAEPLFHRGLYFQAGVAYVEAATHAKALIPSLRATAHQLAQAESRPRRDERMISELSRRISDSLDRILKAELGVVESYRVAGYWLRAYRRIRMTLKELLPLAPASELDKLKSEVALKKVLLYRYPYFFSQKSRMKWLSSRIRGKVKSELSLAVSYFSRHGSWFHLQHCEMLARRFEIDFSSVYAGSMRPLVAQEGYRHLGYFLAEVMAYRSLLSDRTVPNPPLHYSYLTTADELGINPEVWKLARAIKSRFGKGTLTAAAAERARRAWKACEYSRLMRLLLLLRGDSP